MSIILGSIENRTMEHWDIIVTGEVQGVWYRKSARDEAQQLGLNGYVMNRRDGSVQIEAEGPKSALERFVAWCRKGPAGARVDEVKVTPGSPNGYAEFSIRR